MQEQSVIHNTFVIERSYPVFTRMRLRRTFRPR
jgi:hypothetical protein